jgi:dTDP-4-dehydrorhamnose reductase
VLGLDRAAVDLGDPDRISGRLEDHRFDVLVNAAAVTSPDAAEDDPGLAERVNGEAPGVLAEECRRRGARMIQISTDYVFGGGEAGLRSEEDPTNPVSAYGTSKLSGEQTVLAADPGACVLRVSWLYGSGQPGFPEQVIERAESGALELIDDKFSLPTYLPDLMGWIGELLGKSGVSGVLHACSSGEPASWFDWGAATIDEAVACGRLASAPVLGRQSLDDCGFFRAPRPRHTAMSNARLSGVLGKPPRTWRDALREHVRAGT